MTNGGTQSGEGCGQDSVPAPIHSDTGGGDEVTRDGEPMRFAYADPPYLGCSKFYDHPHAADWDIAANHGDLMEHMDQCYDGWALSLSSPSLRELLPLAPDGARIAAWVKPFAAYKANVRIAYTWEPVIFKPGRDSSKDGAPVGRDYLAEPITLQKGLTGAKPARFCRWIADLLGYLEGDQLVDIFPGTGVMARVLAQGVLL